MAEQRIDRIRIQMKRGSSLDWHKASEATTPFIPKEGESIFYTDMNMLKIGNGTSTPDQLPFLDVEHPDETFKTFAVSNYDCDKCTEAGVYLISGGTDMPESYVGGNLLVIPNTDYITQMLFVPGNAANIRGTMFFRYYINKIWTTWEQITTSKHVHQITFTPTGTISSPEIIVSVETDDVIGNFVPGSGSASLGVEIDHKRLSFALQHSHVASTTSTKKVLTAATARLKDAPVFTGTSTTIGTNNAIEEK